MGLRIDRVELFHISMTLTQPFETSFGVEHERPCILVRLEGDGATGWGECVAGSGPWYSYETVGTAWHVLSEFLVPMVLGVDFDHPRDLFDHLRRVRGHAMAKAGLEMAAWDLAATRQGIPLARLLGGERDRVEVGVSIGVQPNLETLLDRVVNYVNQGYRRVKIKIKPGWDVAVTRAVRAAFPDLRLQVDANSAYHPNDIAVFEAIDDLDLLLIEQPLDHDDIFDHAEFQRSLRTPICLDESIASVDHARAALELGSCRNINIKPGRVGGHTASIRIHDLCRSHQIPVWHGGMLETGIGRAHNVALASLPGFTLPGDISASSRYYHSDIVDPPFVLNADSTISVPTGPGIGVVVDEAAIRRMALRHADLGLAT
jgi:o-succinylbenzoate synthase